jgi:hypothetical protein
MPQPLRALLLSSFLVSCAAKSAVPAATVTDGVVEAPSSSSPAAQCLARANAEQTTPANAPASISVSQILVRHQELKHPQGAVRSRSEACLRALSALETLMGGAEWSDTVQQYSDSGQSNNGDLGTIHFEDVTPPFARAAFSLESNELSYVVETDRGFHVILRR